MCELKYTISICATTSHVRGNCVSQNKPADTAPDEQFVRSNEVTPSYKGYRPASEQSSRVKSRNRNRDTKHELALRRELWRRGLRFRKNVPDLPGKPDIVFPGGRVAVFCDGDFWHGRNWQDLRVKLEHRANAPYWIAKIQSNIDRDQRSSQLLGDAGWLVLRFWETDIQRNLTETADSICRALELRPADTVRHNG